MAQMSLRVVFQWWRKPEYPGKPPSAAGEDENTTAMTGDRTPISGLTVHDANHWTKLRSQETIYSATKKKYSHSSQVLHEPVPIRPDHTLYYTCTLLFDTVHVERETVIKETTLLNTTLVSWRNFPVLCQSKKLPST